MFRSVLQSTSLLSKHSVMAQERRLVKLPAMWRKKEAKQFEVYSLRLMCPDNIIYKVLFLGYRTGF
jgi:hypothetical protein